MDFLKKYWWVFVLIIGAILLYWFMMRNNANATTTKKKANPNCPMSVEQWETRLASEIAAAKNDPTYQAYITNKVNDGIYIDEAAAWREEVSFYLVDEEGLCDPTKPPA